MFGDRVRERRLAIGLSQESLAARSGIARAYVGSLEGGQRNPSLDMIARLAIALEVDAGELVWGVQDVAGRT